MITTDPEGCVKISVDAEPRDVVLSTDQGRFLVLVLPLPGLVNGFDRPWKRRFLEWIQKGRSVGTAAQLSGASRQSVYRHRHSDELFRKAWDLVRKGKRKR